MIKKPKSAADKNKTTKVLRNEIGRLERNVAQLELKNKKLHLMLDLQKKTRELIEAVDAEVKLSSSSERTMKC